MIALTVAGSAATVWVARHHGRALTAGSLFVIEMDSRMDAAPHAGLVTPAPSVAPSTPRRSRPAAHIAPPAAPHYGPPPRPAPPPHPGGGTWSDAAAASAVFDAINQSRAQAHLAPLQWSAGLSRSALQHDDAMAGANLLSHQLPGEAALGVRIADQGVVCSWYAENIGWTTELSTAGALWIESQMINERPPNDTHRVNILTTSGSLVGIAVLMDPAHGKLWLTEDFAN